MKKPKMNSNLISNMKNNQNNKNNISNQINNFNKPQSKTKNNSFLQILLKFKTQKSSPHKTPPKSLNKINVQKNIKDSNINIDLNKNMSKAKLINKEINNILSNINNNNNKILTNYNSNFQTENNKNLVYYNNKYQKNYYNKSTKDSPRTNQSNKKKFIDRALNSTISILNKNREKVILKDEQNNNKNPLNLNININQFQINKNKKVLYQKNYDKGKNLNFRNTNICSNYHSNTNTNIDTNIYHLNNCKNSTNTNTNINSMVNYSTNTNNANNNIQYIYSNENSNKKQIILQQNKNISQQRTIFYKNCHRENKYKNINLTNPATMNNSRKTSVEKKLKLSNEYNILNVNIINHNKKNTILNITNNKSHNKSISNNINNKIKQNLSVNYSKERVSYTNNTKNNNNSQNNALTKNNYIDTSYNSIINHNKINHTTVNSPNRNKVPSIQIKIKNNKDNMNKVYLRTGGNHNINNLNIKIPHITTVNSKDLSNYTYNTNKSPDISSNNKTNTNIGISSNYLNLNNNSSFNYSSKQKYKNKNKKQKNNINNNITNNNSTNKTISHKHSFNNLMNENDISNQNQNNITEINVNKKISNSKILNIKNEINMSNNKSTQNYFQLSNNTSTYINNYKKTPKIIDIKKCIIINNRNKSKKFDKNTNYNLINNKRGQSVTNKQNEYNIVNKRPNLKIKNPGNYYQKGRGKKITKNNTVLNSNSITHNSNYVEYTDILDDEKILKRNYSNIGHNKVIKSISNSKSKSLSKSKIKKNLNKNEIHGLIEDIKKIKKKKIIHTTNITSNQSQKNSFNQSKNNLSKKIKTLTVTVTNSNNNSTLKNNNTNTNNSIILFESESKERKKILIKQGKYYLKESERLSKYLNEYFLLNDSYPKSQISFYKYGRLIGKGAFGKVNLGLHILTGRIVAIKSFNKNNLKNERAKSKIYHEINLMKNLRHSSVVKLLDTFETKNYILIVMENISGGDLLSFVKKRTKLNEKICKFIFKQLLQAIKYIHTKNVIHRDIKLDNVLIDLNNNIKLCDFGVGKMIHEGEILTDQCGTPAYIAPEILENKGYEGPPVDIWSSGVVLYAMLSGTVPFKANNLNDLQNMIMTGNFKEIPEISKESNDLLHKLLQVNPQKRITVDEAMNHPWFNSINNIGVNNNIFEDNKLSLFTKAEMVLLSKNNIDYRNCTKEEMIENFTLKNLDTKNISENKNNLTKSFIFAPFNSSYMNDEIKKTHLEENLTVENNIILFDEKINILNRQYELNNNGEIDHGVLINRSNMTSRSNITNNNDNSQKKNVSKEKNVEVQPAQNTEDDKSKKILSCSNSKKSINISKEKELNVPNRNKGNYLNSMLTYSSTAIIDENILKSMETFGYKKEYIQKCITNNEINYCSATYYLLSSSSEMIS